MSVIKAGTTLTTAYTVEADTNGDLVFQTNGSTTALTLTSAQSATFERGLVVNEGGADSDTRIEGDTDTNLFFVDASTDRIGIGTDTPNRKLNIASSGANCAFRIDNTVSGRPFLIAYDDSQNLTFTNSSDSGYIAFVNGTGAGTERLRLDTAGNLGLGVSPSAWSVLGPAIQLGGAGAFVSGQGSTEAAYFGSNAFYDGSNWKYVITDEASFYRQFAGSHAWFTAASGTAGNTISFTTALTLNTSGNLVLQGGSTGANGIGVTFPASQSTSSDANCLDDYEEGTWTPTSVVSGFTQSISALTGKYTKIGRLVQIEMIVTLSSIGRPTSYSQFGALPFSALDTPVGVFAGGNPGTGIQGGSIIGSTTSVFWYATNGATDSGTWQATMVYTV